MPIREFISKLSPRGWAMVGIAAAVSIIFLVVVMQMASAPSYSTLLTGLDPAQTGKITSTLDTKGISYQLQNNGTALAVDFHAAGMVFLWMALVLAVWSAVDYHVRVLGEIRLD